MQASDPSITGFIVAVMQETQRHPDLLALLAPQRGRHQAFFSELVSAARERGELAPDLDDGALADLLGAVVVGLARMTATSNDTDRLSGAVEVLGRFLDGSLLATPR